MSDKYLILSKKHLKDGLENGYIILKNDIRELKANEILAIAKYIVKEGINLEESSNSDKVSVNKNNLPSEMLILDLENEEDE